jgi:N-acyl-D-aspartate/D-glutamate deacylase
MFDLIIKGGEVIDGTGTPRRRTDVGVTGPRITAIGDLTSAEARRVIDAKGRIVTPGFIDVHTHIDAQAFWDSTLSPSPLHGITTMIGGNCGFSIQPLSAELSDRNYLMRMLARVEGMPLKTLEDGVPWNWASTSEYISCLDHTLSVNTAFMVGHSTLRRLVMGDDSTKRTATPDEVRAMCNLLRTGIEAGALGFSSSWSTTHNDADGNKVPSRYAEQNELVALCAVLADFDGTSLEFIPCVGPIEPWAAELMADMSVAAQAPLNWNVISAVHTDTMNAARAKLTAGDVAAARGGRVVALTTPMRLQLRLSFASGFVFDAIPGWEGAMLSPIEEKCRLLKMPAERQRLGELAAAKHAFSHNTDWEKMYLYATFSPENAGYTGRTVGEVAQERRQSPWDALCDIALADDLRTSFGIPIADSNDDDWKARTELWQDPRAVVGASDAGAHLDMFISAHYPTAMLSGAVVERQLLPLEVAIRLLTSVPADLYGVVDRGRLAEGAFADLVVLDEYTVGPSPITMRDDLPGGAQRLYATANGVDHVVCNGQPIVDHGIFTNARPGEIFRSGRDTRNAG